MPEPIIVDIGLAVEQLKNNPELAESLMQLVAPVFTEELDKAYNEIERLKSLLANFDYTEKLQ